MLDQMLNAPWGGFGKSVGATLIPTAPYDPLSYMETPSPTGDEMTPLSIDKLKAQLAEKAKTATIEPTAEPVTVTPKTAFESVKDVSEAGGALPAVPPKLALAKFMYQETKGTQNPYYAVAIGPGLKVGARWSPHALAIRFEGPDLQGDAAKWLSMAGIEMKTGYASCHIGFEGENNLSLMQRTLLSMIGATMYKFNSPIPSIERLKKCSQPKSFGL
jgi:hypothetical protein